MTNPNADVRKFLPRQFVEVFGPNIPGILKAINESLLNTELTIQACIDQLFTSTASGTYLVKLGEEQGFTMPPNSGLDIRAYKELIPIMVADPKQVRISMEALVRAFYGSDRTNPNLQSTINGPFSLNDGDDLIVETDAGTATITIGADQVSDLSNVSATELSAIINYSQDILSSDTITNRATGNDYVRIINKTPGQGAHLKVVGGTLQNVVKFPKLVNTACTTGTTYTLSKEFPYSDTLTFTWNGVGVNPELYLVAANDYLTVRGLVDGAEPYSLLNGSYQVVDSGYDYFVVRNTPYQALVSTLTQNLDNNLVFSKNSNTTLFDRSEYAFLSETINQTITVTVPAVPPLAKRSLIGSAHLRGQYSTILDFSRNSVQIRVGAGEDAPITDNKFYLANTYKRLNFKSEPFVTVNSDLNATQPTYIIDTSTQGNAVLPFTVATAVGTDAIHGEIGSEDYTLSFANYEHGLDYTWGFTLASAVGASNILSADLNKEQQVYVRVNDNSVMFKIRDSAGVPKKFAGISWGVSGSYPDIYQQSTPQLDASDFYLSFPTIGDATASGLAPGQSFYLDGSGGTNVNAYLGNLLRFRKLEVKTVLGNQVTFSAGIGAGPNGLIVSSIYGTRSGSFGGASTTYFLDKTSATNQDRVFSNLRALFINRTPPGNPEYVGSFIYDPSGVKTTVTVSKYVSKLTSQIFRGDNPPEILVESLLSADGSPFPTAGSLVLGYGTDKFEGPISYYATIENLGQNQILIDPAYRFKKTHMAGTTAQYIHAKVPFSPSRDGIDYQAYITGTASARNTMFKLFDLLVAAGIFVDQNVLIPKLRNGDPSSSPFA